MSYRTPGRSYPVRWPAPGNGERIQADRPSQFGINRVQPPGAEALYSMHLGRCRVDCRAPILKLPSVEYS